MTWLAVSFGFDPQVQNFANRLKLAIKMADEWPRNSY